MEYGCEVLTFGRAHHVWARMVQPPAQRARARPRRLLRQMGLPQQQRQPAPAPPRQPFAPNVSKPLRNPKWDVD